MATTPGTTRRSKPAPKPAPKPATKSASKPATKSAAKPAAKPAAKAAPAKATKSPKASKAPKAPKPEKLVRDSFTMPKSDHQALVALKQRSISLAQPAKKSEIVRAGLKLLAALDDTALRAALAAVPALKTGRPKGAGQAGA